MRVQIVIVVAIQVLTAFYLSYNEAVLFKFTKIYCKSFNESWIVIHNCRMRAVSRNKTVLNFNGTVLYPAYKIHVRAELFKKANGFKPWLVNMTVDGCRFIKKPFNPVAILIFKFFRDFTNFNHSCPYVGPQIVDGLYLRLTHLPQAIHNGDYMLGLTWMFDLRPQFMTNVYYIFQDDLSAKTF